MKKGIRHHTGQALLELVVALGITALVLTGLVSAVTSSLRYGEASRFRSRGVKYAQEALELTRKLRDTNPWETFLGYSGSGTKTWCLNETGVWSEDTSSMCPFTETSAYFRRNVTFTWTDPVMDVTTQVSWADHTAASTLTLRTYFTQWK